MLVGWAVAERAANWGGGWRMENEDEGWALSGAGSLQPLPLFTLCPSAPSPTQESEDLGKERGGKEVKAGWAMREVEITRNLQVPRSSLFFVQGDKLQQSAGWDFVLSYLGLWRGGPRAGDDLHCMPLQTAVALSPLSASWGAQTRSRAAGHGR